jgi:hypothetical protein
MSSSVGSADRPSDNDEDAIKVISPDDGEERMEGERERERERERTDRRRKKLARASCMLARRIGLVGV